MIPISNNVHPQGFRLTGALPNPHIAPMPKALRRILIHPLALLPLVLIGLFWRSFDPSLTLCSGDASLAVIAQTYLLKPAIFLAPWSAFNGLGAPLQPLALAPGFLLVWIVPFYKYVDANVLLHLLLLGIGGFLLLQESTRHRWAALLGGLFFMLQPHVVSHLLPGHVGHFIMVGWTPLAFFALRRTILTADPLYALLTGLAFGLLLAAGQHDVAAFFGFTLAAYGLFLLFRRSSIAKAQPTSLSRIIGALSLAALVSLLLSAQALFANLLDQLRHHTEATAQESVGGNPEMTPRELWLWATQWSVPPVETVDAAIPGLFGWGSATPENPYRGRIGQTEGWREHQGGLPNLNDVCQYVGAVMLLGVVLAWRYRWRDPETWFFTATALIALLLAWGKFGPLYRFFYALPGMNTLRNPIKWYYITSFSCGVLGAFGYSALLSSSERGPRSVPSAAFWSFLPGIVVLLVGAIVLHAYWADPFFLQTWRSPNPDIQRFLADQIRTQSIRALGLAALFWSMAGTAVFLLLRFPLPHPAARIGVGLTVVTLVAELLAVNVHYLPYQPWRPIVQSGPFTDFLKSDMVRPSRLRFLRQDGLFHYLREVAATAGAENADPYPARLPDAFLRMQTALERTAPLTFWHLCNVRYVVAPQRLGLPDLTPCLSLKGGDQTVIVHEYRASLPRAWRVTEWEMGSEADALRRMADPRFDPAAKAIVHGASEEGPPPPAGGSFKPTGSCTLLHSSVHALTLETEGNVPGVIVIANRYDSGWKAWLNGQPVPLRKVNYLLQGVTVPAGRYKVELRYAPSKNRLAFFAAVAGWIVTAGGFLLVMLIRRASRAHRRPLP